MKRRVGLVLGAILLSLAKCALTTDFILNIHGKRPIFVSDHRFLSVDVDPIELLRAIDEPRNANRSLILAKALSPAYVRFGCPTCNSRDSKRPTHAHEQNSTTHTNFTFSETQWTNLHEWSKSAGLDVIACIPPEMINDEDRRPGDQISFSGRMGYTSGWQVGYECGTGCNVTGAALGKRVCHLRDALNTLPRYSDSVIIGPDVLKCATKEEQGFLEDYFATADHALPAITWRPDPPEATLKENDPTFAPDNLADLKRDLDERLPESALNKPLWIAESEPEAGFGQYLGALFWARRLGSAAKLGVEVVMRQRSDLLEPTPVYWVSLLHKILVGREVLGMKILMKNESDVLFYSQCTRPTERYAKGSVTIFGVNLAPTKATARLKGITGKTVHEYILKPRPDIPNKLLAKDILLNNVPLELTDDGKIPDISPMIIVNDKGLNIKLAPYSIGFWVVPDANMKACTGEDKEILTKRFDAHRTTSSINEIDDIQNIIDASPPLNAPETKRNILQKSPKKQRDLTNVEADQREKLSKIGARRELRKLEKFVKRRLSANERSSDNPKSTSGSDFAELKQMIEGTGGIKRPRRSTIKSFADNLNARKDAASRVRTRLEEERERRQEKKSKERKREYAPAHLENKNDKDEDFYGFVRREPVDNFPKNDVYLTTGDSTEDKDYDYVKDDDEVKDEQRQAAAALASEQDDTWVEDGNDFRGYVPNEFFENVRIHNVRVQNVKDFSELWEADCDCKDRSEVADQNTKLGDDSKTLKAAKVHADEIQYENAGRLNNEWSAKGTSYFENSDDGRIEQDSQIARFGQQMQTDGEHQRLSGEADQVTPGRINHFSNERDSWRNGRLGGSRRPRRESGRVEELNRILYNEMINEDERNLKDCDCNQRVIRGLGVHSEHCNCEGRRKRDVVEEHRGGVHPETTTHVDEKGSAKQLEEIIPNRQNETDRLFVEDSPRRNLSSDIGGSGVTVEPNLDKSKSFSTSGKEEPVLVSKVQYEDKEKNKESTANLQKIEDERKREMNHPPETVEKDSSLFDQSPLFDEIPQIVINEEFGDQATNTGNIDDVENETCETSTPLIEKVDVNISTQRMLPIKTQMESDERSTISMYPKETETKKALNSATPEIEHVTVKMNIGNESTINEKSSETKTNHEDHKDSTPEIEHVAAKMNISNESTRNEKSSQTKADPEDHKESTPEIEQVTVKMNTDNESAVNEKSSQTKANPEDHKESTPEIEHVAAKMNINDESTVNEKSNLVKKDVSHATPTPNIKRAEDVITENTPYLKMRSQFISLSTLSPKFSELDDETEKSPAEPANPSLNTELEDMLKPAFDPSKGTAHGNSQNPATAKETIGKIKRQSRTDPPTLFRDLEGRREKMASDLQGTTPAPEGSTTMALDKVPEDPESLDPPVETPEDAKLPTENAEPSDDSDLYAGKIESALGVATRPDAEKSAIYLAECTDESSAKDEQDATATESYATTTLPPEESKVPREKVLESRDIEPISTTSKIELDETGKSSGEKTAENSAGTSVMTESPVGGGVTAVGNLMGTNVTLTENLDGENVEKVGHLDGRNVLSVDSSIGTNVTPMKNMREEGVVSTGNLSRSDFPSMENSGGTDVRPAEHSVGTSVTPAENSIGTSVRVAENSVGTNIMSMKNPVEGVTSTENLMKNNVPSMENSVVTNVASMKNPIEKGVTPTENLVKSNVSSTEVSAEKNVSSGQNSVGANVASTENSFKTNVSSTENPTKSNVPPTTNSIGTNVPSTEKPAGSNVASTKDSETDDASKGSADKNLTSTSSANTKTKPDVQSSKDESVKVGARFATRSDALSALKRENDARRARRLAEYIKYQEYQRKRAQQLDDLRERLRQKREKILQKYKTDLLALEKSYDEAGRILKRRDAFRDVEEDDLTDFSDPRKPAYFLTYAPADYGLETKYLRRETGERTYTPLAEFEKPLRATKRTVTQNYSNRRSSPRNLISSTRHPDDIFGDEENVDGNRGGRSFHTFLDSVQAPWTFEYNRKPFRNDYSEIEPFIYDRSSESVDPEAYDYDDIEATARRLFKEKASNTERRNLEFDHADEFSRKFPWPKMNNRNEEAENAALEEYDDREDEKWRETEAADRFSRDKDNENRPVIYLFDSNRQRSIPNNVYEQSVRALLNILAQRTVDRDIVRSSDAKDTLKNKRSPNDSVGDYLPNSRIEVEEAKAKAEIGSDLRAMMKKETNRRDKRHANDREPIDAFKMAEDASSLTKMAADSGNEVERNISENFKGIARERTDEAEPNEDPLFREHFRRKDQLLKERRESKNVLIKRLKAEARTEPTSVAENTPRFRNGTVDGFERVRNLTESSEEFAEDFPENSNETLVDGEQKRIDENGGSNAVVHDALGTAITNINKFFAFLCGIVRALHG